MFRWNNRTPTRTCSCKIWGLVGFLLTLMIVSKYLWCRFYARTCNTRRSQRREGVGGLYLLKTKPTLSAAAGDVKRVWWSLFWQCIVVYYWAYNVYTLRTPRWSVVGNTNRNLGFSHLGALFSDYDKEQIELPFLGVTSADLDIKTSEPSVGANIYLVSSDM